MRALLIALIAASLAEKLPAETFDNARDGFQITVPRDWVEIGKEDLAKINAEARKAVKTAAAPEYSYGYRSPAIAGMKFPPYILVWVKTDGRVPESQLKAIPKLDQTAVAKAARDAASSHVQSLAINATAYDESRHILWATAEASYPGIGAVGILSGGVLTEAGILWVYGYAPRDRFDEAKPTLASVIESVQLAESRRYKPRALDFLSGKGFSVPSFVIWGVVGGFIGVIVHLLRSAFSKPAA